MKYKRVVFLAVCLTLLLGGCSTMNDSKEKDKKADDGTTPVAEYKGQGFIFVDGDKSKPIVEKKTKLKLRNVRSRT